MEENNESYRAFLYESVSKIPEEYWQFLKSSKSNYFHQDFIKAIDKNHKKIGFVYCFLVNTKDIPVAFSSIKIVDLYLDEIENNSDVTLSYLKKIARKIRLLPNKKPLKLIISGNIFVSGEHGLYIKDGVDKKMIFKGLVKSIYNYVNQKPELKIDAFLIKDFENESLSITNALKNFNYHPFLVEPNMVMNIDSKWNSFDDYLTTLKTKFRVKANKAMELSKKLHIVDVTTKNIHSQLEPISSLYNKVATNAKFNLSKFNVDAYKELITNFSNTYILKTLWLNNTMVGFMSGMIHKNQLDAHFVGIDYSFNKEYAIYQKMLYEYIDIAINQKLDQINFGRTASEIKSSVGAKPKDLTMYLRHKKGFTNQILKLFLQRIQPTPFKQKKPFKINYENE